MSNTKQRKQQRGQVGTGSCKKDGETQNSLANISRVLNRVAAVYHQCFCEDPRALEYLKQRGISSNAIFSDYQIGYSNGTLLNMIPGQGDIREALTEIGIIEGTEKERFYGCVVFPVFDENRDCVGLYGRRMGDGEPAHVRLSGASKGVFNHQAVKRSDKIILTESIIEALTLINAGICSVVPCYGADGLTEEHMELFKRHRTREVFVCFGQDGPARQGAEHAMRRLRESAITAYEITLSPTHAVNGRLDINQFFLVEPDAQAVFDRILRDASLSAAPADAKGEKRRKLRYEITNTGFLIRCGDRTYDILNLVKEGVKRRATIKAILGGDEPGRGRGAKQGGSLKAPFHVDTVDLYSHRSRLVFARTAALLFSVTVEVVLGDILRIIDAAEEWQPNESAKRAVDPMTESEKKVALQFLGSADLFDRILDDFEALGITGENANKLMCYIAATSRNLDEPLSVLIQSRSAAGKSTLQDAVLSLMPSEDCIKYTRLTDQALFYKDENSLVHKLVAIEEEQGAREASYSIRNMQSSKYLSIATTGKDAATGRLKTEEYRVKGPVALMITTTEVELDYETANRFIVLTIDESADMTERILQKQRERDTLEGALRKAEAERIMKRHHNVQRLLRPIMIINPYAPHLTYPSAALRSRRDQKKYLGLIKAIAFLHQYQRETKSMESLGETIHYIEVTLDDIEMANRLAAEVLGRTLDELSPPSIQLLKAIHEMVEAECRKRDIQPQKFHFTRKDIREYAKWSNFQIKCHIKQLEDLEYLYSVRGKRGREYVYELLYSGGGENGASFMMGLTDTAQLRSKLGNLEGTRRPEVG